MFASGSKKARGAYITIPTELPADERDLSRIGELVESAKEQYKHERGVSDALVSDEDELVSLADMSLDGIERVLVVGCGSRVEEVLAACRAAALAPCAAYTEDLKDAPYLALAEQKICIGACRADGAFDDNYRVLSAAEVVRAEAILLVGSHLAGDERFIGMACDDARSVFRLEETSTSDAFGGLTKAWAPCRCENGVSAQASPDAWMVCPKCRAVLDAAHVHEKHKTCPSCGHHFRMTSSERIFDLVDEGSFQDWDVAFEEGDPLRFPGYLEKIEAMRARTDLSEGVRCGAGRIAGMPVVICVMDSTFFMGSMGSVVGERITHAVERATAEGLPLVIFSASGGARMQEGLVSLMQMAKISCAIERHAQAGLTYFSVITDPTTGGVTASFAMQGDVIIAEPKALIGFAGRRVIQDTIRQELPKEFQTAEFALEHGLIDAIVHRSDLRGELANLLALCAAGSCERRMPFDVSGLGRESIGGVAELREALAAHPSAHECLEGAVASAGGAGSERSAGSLRSAVRAAFSRVPRLHKKQSAWERRSREESSKRLAALLTTPVRNAGEVGADGAQNPAWASVQTARDVHRPTSMHYLRSMTDGFFELHGDRAFADDGAIVAGIGWIGRSCGGDCPGKRCESRRAHPPQLRLSPAGGVSQKPACNALCRAFRAARGVLGGYAGGVLRQRGRRTRARRRHRRQPFRHGGSSRAHCEHFGWRRRVGRRARARAGRRHPACRSPHEPDRRTRVRAFRWSSGYWSARRDSAGSGPCGEVRGRTAAPARTRRAPGPRSIWQASQLSFLVSFVAEHLSHDSSCGKGRPRSPPTETSMQ